MVQVSFGTGQFLDRPVLVRSGLCEKAIPSPSSEPGSSSSDPSSFGTSESIADPYSSVFDNVKLSLKILIRKSGSRIYFGQVKQSKNTISRYDDTLVRKYQDITAATDTVFHSNIYTVWVC